MTKRFTALFSALLLMFSLSVTAFADSNFDKKIITDAWFKYIWDEENCNSFYETAFGYEVPISENPFAATTYARIEQTVNILTDDDFNKINLSMNSLDNDYYLDRLDNTYWGYWDGHDEDIGLTLIYDNGMERYEDGESQKDGVWLISESTNELYNDEKYRRVKFIDNGDSFTMVTEKGNEELGTYKKVYQFDTDEYIGFTGDNGNGGGSTGGTGTGAIGGSIINGDNEDRNENKTDTVVSKNAISDTTSSNNTSFDRAVTRGNKTSSVLTGSNPPVTPEVVSTVDAAKAAMEAENNSHEAEPVTVSHTEKKGNTLLNVLILILVLAVIGGAVIYLNSRQRKSK